MVFPLQNWALETSTSNNEQPVLTLVFKTKAHDVVLAHTKAKTSPVDFNVTVLTQGRTVYRLWHST